MKPQQVTRDTRSFCTFLPPDILHIATPSTLTHPLCPWSEAASLSGGLGQNVHAVVQGPCGQCGSISLTGMRCNNGPSSTPAQVRAQTTPERRMESASQKASCCPRCAGDTVVRRAGAWRPRLGCARADGHLLCLGAESIPVCADLNALVAHRGFLAEGFGKVVVHESGCCRVLTRRC